MTLAELVHTMKGGDRLYITIAAGDEKHTAIGSYDCKIIKNFRATILTGAPGALERGESLTVTGEIRGDIAISPMYFDVENYIQASKYQVARIGAQDDGQGAFVWCMVIKND